MGTRHLKIGDSVRLLRNIYRLDDSSPHLFPRFTSLYGEAGEEGVIEELFRPPSSSGGQWGDLRAKVRTSDGKLKTYRITSFEVLP